MSKWSLLLVALTLSNAVASSAHADAYCVAVPDEILTTSDGMVIVHAPFRSDWVGVCNLRSAWKGVDAQVCWAWFSTASNAVTEHKTLGMYYSGFPQSACSGIGTYENSPAPSYVRISGS